MTLQMEVKKDGLRQMQSGEWKLSLTVHPNDMGVELMQAVMGTRYMCAMVEIGDDCQPVKPTESQHMGSVPKQGSGETKPRLTDRSRYDQKRRLCGVREFQDWLQFDDHGCPFAKVVTTESKYRLTSAAVKDRCGIQSGRELNTPGPAQDKWDALVAEFQQATGQMAEAR